MDSIVLEGTMSQLCFANSCNHPSFWSVSLWQFKNVFFSYKGYDILHTPMIYYVSHPLCLSDCKKDELDLAMSSWVSKRGLSLFTCLERPTWPFEPPGCILRPTHIPFLGMTALLQVETGKIRGWEWSLCPSIHVLQSWFCSSNSRADFMLCICMLTPYTHSGILILNGLYNEIA